MDPLVTGLIVFASLFLSGLLGLWLRSTLPEHHLSPDTKDTVRVAMGLVATMAALVLGLLVASAKGTYDVEKTEVTEAVARIRFLDGVLADYGPDATPVRAVLRHSAEQALIRLWPENNVRHVSLDPGAAWASPLRASLQSLTPQDPAHIELKAEAMGVASQLAQIRWLVAEQSKTPVATALLVIVVVWMAMIFVSLGVFAPRNHTIVVAFAAAALSVAGAIFLILELSHPFSGIIRISSEPLVTALEQLGR
jgi:hypothetical protein